MDRAPGRFASMHGARGRVRFSDLMRFRVHQILLVSSLYDSFILAEDGHLNAAILGEFLELNLSHTPDLTRVSTGRAALALLESGRQFDLIVTSLRVGELNAAELARRVHALRPELPVVLLAYNHRELTDFRAQQDTRDIERVFLWQGDVGILLAMVNHVEDRHNLAHDCGELGVPAIIVVEDNVRYYSSFLPVIYREMMVHGQSLIAEGVNLSQKMLRLRARPKIVLCERFESAWELFETYGDDLLGVISDIEFPWEDGPQDRAGVELASRMRRRRPDLPIMLQSSFSENERLAEEVGASFLLKGSPVLLQQLRRFIVEHFGFGEFIFRLPDGTEIARVSDLRALVLRLRTVPEASLAYHGERNHFSNWLKARGEFALAHQLRPRRVGDYGTIAALRRDLIRSIGDYRRRRDRVDVADYSRKRLDRAGGVARIGGGSLGGKARGLAFANRLLDDARLADGLPGVRVYVPPAVVLGTDVFDAFLDANDLRDFALGPASDSEIAARFLAAEFPPGPRADLEAFLQTARWPLAVRSSGLLEDSPSQPLAGVYQTLILPNAPAEGPHRLERLLQAVVRVYASTFSQRAKAFLATTPFRLEQEKMAVIVQRLAGRPHGRRFYPDFAGVARSHDFYPTPPQRAEDGVAAVALGLGRTVVEGGACVRFCPRYPRREISFSAVDQALRESQRSFWALDLDAGAAGAARADGALTQQPLAIGEADGTLAAVGSTYSPDNDAIYDGIARPGVRLVSFAPVLKHDRFPLAALVDRLLAVGCEGTSGPVEIEFAVTLDGDGRQGQLAFLQLRPLALSREAEAIEIGPVTSESVLCRSARVLGNGRIDDLRDIVIVDADRFDRLKSATTAQDVARMNARLQQCGTNYLLIGVGRWGSAEPHLGIPVSWNQIAGARVIVEAGLRDLRVEPSQGTHFFQNLTSCHVGYFTVNATEDEGFIDWEWLGQQPAVEQVGAVRHLHLSAPLVVTMSGMTGRGVILKPET